MDTIFGLFESNLNMQFRKNLNPNPRILASSGESDQPDWIRSA